MATSTSMTVSGGADEKPSPQQPPSGKQATGEPRAGFFTIHKPTQGRTTRITTGIGAALLVGLTVHFLLTQVPAWFFPPTDQGASTGSKIWTGVVIVLGVLMAAIGWRLINRPDHAEFLIATDSEMKKVNWTSRKELWGSTKVVIFFMLAIAGILFLVDLVFHWLFFLIDVLKFKPFGM